MYIDEETFHVCGRKELSMPQNHCKEAHKVQFLYADGNVEATNQIDISWYIQISVSNDYWLENYIYLA